MKRYSFDAMEELVEHPEGDYVTFKDAQAEIKPLRNALRSIATNLLSQSTDHSPAYRAGVRVGLAIAADMARRALDGIEPPANPDAPCRHLEFCPHCNPALEGRL